MATMYLVQGYRQKGRQLVGDQPQAARSADAAMALAERMGTSRAGVIAYSQEVDVETDTYDEPRVLVRLGTLPEGLLE